MKTLMERSLYWSSETIPIATVCKLEGVHLIKRIFTVDPFLSELLEDLNPTPEPKLKLNPETFSPGIKFIALLLLLDEAFSKFNS